jgi:simple sugar transport system permease protein
MIFGNWRPSGLLVAALLFGYTQSINLRGGTDSLHSLLLAIAIMLAGLAIWNVRQKAMRQAILLASGAGAFLLWYLMTDSVSSKFTGMAPYVTTLLVLAFASQRLRMPAADGQIYRKGSAG